eukprot:3449206-Amphidinium_carterae.2
MERGTGEVLKECLSRSSATSRFYKEYQQQTRLVSSDSASYNLAAEAGLMSDGVDEDWRSVFSCCEIHSISIAFKKVFSGLMGNEVKGLIHTASSLRVSSNMTCFRRALKLVLQENWSVKFGSAPLAAGLYKQQMLAIFVTAGRNVLLDRMLLSQLEQHSKHPRW